VKTQGGAPRFLAKIVGNFNSRLDWCAVVPVFKRVIERCVMNLLRREVFATAQLDYLEYPSLGAVLSKGFAKDGLSMSSLLQKPQVNTKSAPKIHRLSDVALARH
jgi:hypothetical protein